MVVMSPTVARAPTVARTAACSMTTPLSSIMDQLIIPFSDRSENTWDRGTICRAICTVPTPIATLLQRANPRTGRPNRTPVSPSAETHQQTSHPYHATTPCPTSAPHVVSTSNETGLPWLHSDGSLYLMHTGNTAVLDLKRSNFTTVSTRPLHLHNPHFCHRKRDVRDGRAPPPLPTAARHQHAHAGAPRPARLPTNRNQPPTQAPTRAPRQHNFFDFFFTKISQRTCSLYAHHYIHSRLHCTQRTCHDTSQSSIHTPIKSHGGVLEYIRTVPQRTKAALRTELQRTSQREIEPVSHLIAHHTIGPVPSLHRAVHRVIEPTRSRKSTEQ